MDHRLFDAARTGDITTLKLLLQEDPLLLERLSLSSPENPLHVSAFTGQAAFTAEILRHNQGLALEPNLQGFSPLHIASASGKIEVVRVLLSVGEKRDLCFLKDKDGLIPLHSAAQRGRIEVIKELVSSFPESLEEQTAFLETPLHVAVKNNQVEATKLLLLEIKNRDTSWGIVNQENREGNTILHLATLGKQLQIVEMLIGEEAILHGSVDVNKQNRSWLTPKDVLDVVIETEGGSVSEMHRIVQIFQTAEARNANEKRKNLKPIDRSRNPLRMIKRYLDYEITNSTLEKRETLLVVATLIATLTFTGVLQPPGAFRGEDSSGGSGSQNNNNTTPIINTNFGSRNSTEGQAIMAASTVDFTLYATFNAIGFFASVTMISLLTKGFPLRNWIRLCIISIVAIYLVAVVYIAPNEKTFWLVVLSVSSLLVLRESYLFFKSLLKAFRVARRL
ncbi:PREDICTED: ankyrin repeat-containing protein ITN1-like [Camelina sativa]|uniref:Ankyrin repeat-containing protein ITN1-like n=1 Tax=Camelina sativa TaxID=90675 RepID=A0ABM0YVB6_CAMSA|nr:PREDICTED: ankyrin repeat-containing protein ITN1-like [Camelina sativa]